MLRAPQCKNRVGARSALRRSAGNGESTSRQENQLPRAVDRASSSEKSVRQGHISTFQQWWARRPLAVCRAAIFAALCPESSVIEQNAAVCEEIDRFIPGPHSIAWKLSEFTSRLAQWEAVKNDKLLVLARTIIRVNRETNPVILDTFAGGGSIPIEALRLGLETIAGELNPVAWFALRVALEDLAGCGPSVLRDFDQVCVKVGEAVRAATNSLYATEANQEPLAFFWCWTSTCPACKATIPLLRDHWLAKGSRNAAVRISRFQNDSPIFDVYHPRLSEDRRVASKGTVDRTGAVCPRCDHNVPLGDVRKNGRSRRLGNFLYAKLILDATGNRTYLAADESDRELARTCRFRRRAARLKKVPDLSFDLNGIRHLWAIQYGIRSTSDLFNQRQGVALLELFSALTDAKDGLLKQYDEKTAQTLISLLALVFNRILMYGTRHAWWQPNGEFPANMFTKQAIPMVWNYVEIPVSSVGAAGWDSAVTWIKKAVEHLSHLPHSGKTWLGDAAATSLGEAAVDLVAIDPPYYDSIAYGYLSDVFYAWMKEYVGDMFPAAFSSEASPKADELIVDRPHTLAPAPKDGEFFRHKFTATLREANRVLKPDGRLLVMFGHKQVDAWVKVLTAIHDAGFEVLESWPTHTERKVKFRHATIDALSSSSLLYCQKYDDARDPSYIDGATFDALLKTAVTEAMDRYRRANIYGSDLSVACLATASRLYWRYHLIDSASPLLSLGGLLRNLPKLVDQCEIDCLLQESAIKKHPALHQELKASSEKVGSAETATAWGSTKDPLAALAVDYARALYGSDPDRADGLVRSLGPTEKSSLPLILRALAVLGPEGSLERQLANAGLGRLALASRSAAACPLFEELELS